MSYIGTKPADAALTASDITDGIISTAKVTDDAVTLAKMASGTDGNLITYDASGNPAAVATGSSGEFLKSQGAGSVPVFAAAGGAWNLQRTQTASGATTIDFVHGASGVDLTTYKIYKIIAVDLDSSADGVTVKMEYSDDTGSSYETSAYECTTDHVIYGNSNNQAVNSTASAMHIENLGNAAGETCSFEFTFANPASALNKAAWYNGAVEDSNGALRIFSGSSIWGSTADVDAIRLTMSSGTFSGIIKLYGIS